MWMLDLPLHSCGVLLHIPIQQSTGIIKKKNVIIIPFILHQSQSAIYSMAGILDPIQHFRPSKHHFHALPVSKSTLLLTQSTHDQRHVIRDRMLDSKPIVTITVKLYTAKQMQDKSQTPNSSNIPYSSSSAAPYNVTNPTI